VSPAQQIGELGRLGVRGVAIEQYGDGERRKRRRRGRRGRRFARRPLVRFFAAAEGRGHYSFGDRRGMISERRVLLWC
jgi:hypothetical protein